MFSIDNTDGFTATQLDVLNAALKKLVAQGYETNEAHDKLNNAWSALDERNTVEQLVQRASK